MNGLIKWWDNGMGTGFGRKFSLGICAIWLYTILILDIFQRFPERYVGWGFSFVIITGALYLDSHNEKAKVSPSQKTGEKDGRKN